MRQTLLQSSFNPTTALVFRLEQLPTWGFGPLLDVTTVRSLARGLPSPRYVPSSGVHSLSTVCSALWLAGLFHPAAELRTTARSGASHSVQPSFLIGRRCPHAVGTRLADPQAGCRKPSSSTSRRCSVRSRVPSVRELASPPVAPLIGIDAPPGALLAVSSLSSSSFAHGVAENRPTPCKHGTKGPATRLQRFGDEKPDRFVSDPIDLLELLSLLQLGNRVNGPRTGKPARPPATHLLTRGFASPERPPKSPSSETGIALLRHRRSNHEPRRAATGSPEPPSSAASDSVPDGVGHSPNHPEERSVEVTGPTRTLAERSPLSPTRACARAG